MKSLQRVLCAVFALLVSGCSDPVAPIREPRREFTVQEVLLAGASISFGLGLYQHAAAAEEKANLLLSPLSASMALGMTMNGAAGETHDAMRRALGFGTLSEAQINEAYKGLSAQLVARDRRVQLEVANSVWHERGFSVLQPFIDAARNYFDAEVTPLNFGDPTAPKTINSWAEKKTNGRIKDLLDRIDDAEVMFLVNAVYFKAPWTERFDASKTRNGSFTRADGSRVTVPFMSKDGSYRVARTNDAIAVELFYGDSAFSMVLAMPATGNALTSLEQKLSPAWWSSTLAALRPAKGPITLPKFKLEYGRRLNDELIDLGMGIAFDKSRADFWRIADTRPRRLYITRVDQKSFIEVNEAGTEAAAATVVGIGLVCACTPQPIEFNRPFLFAIRERETGAILFIGRLGDPTAQ